MDPRQRVEELRQQRAALYDQMQKIDGKAARQGRSLYPDEQKEWERLEASFDQLAAEVEQLERARPAPDHRRRGRLGHYRATLPLAARPPARPDSALRLALRPMPPGGLEPPTRCLEGSRSLQLSYGGVPRG